MKAFLWVTSVFFTSAALFGQAAPPRLEFEVASVKPSPPMDGPRLDLGVHVDGAQYRANFFSLRDYIRIAYKVKPYQVIGPDWIGSERFDISATIPKGAPRDAVNEMMQNLLADRFGLKLHRDHKEFPVYALVVAKSGSKLKEVPPDSDADQAEAANAPVEVRAQGGPQGVGVSLGNGSSFSFGNNKFEARKLDMARVADTLSSFLERPVVDMTGLKGRYDFTLEITAEDYRAMLIRSAVTAGVALPPEALRMLDGATDDSLHTALAAVGLRLEPRKAPLEVIVVDHAEKTPTAN